MWGINSHDEPLLPGSSVGVDKAIWLRESVFVCLYVSRISQKWLIMSMRFGVKSEHRPWCKLVLLLWIRIHFHPVIELQVACLCLPSLLFLLSFLNPLCEWTAAAAAAARCLQPHDGWSLCIPACHWRGWLMFRECSGGWCLPLPLRVSTWHVPSGKHIRNWLTGLRCLQDWLAVLVARYLAG